jgi:hypothetical protein
MVGPALTAAAPFLARAGQIAPWLLTGASFAPNIAQALNQPGTTPKSSGRRRGARPTKTATKRPEGYSTYGTYTVGGIEYDINSGRPTYMPPGSVYPSSSVAPFKAAPAERSYQAEKARAQQLTEQDPLFKKYQVADLTKQYNTAATPEEKQNIGLQIWAQTNPQLAAKLRPGQVGYQEVRQAPGMAVGYGGASVSPELSFAPGFTPEQMQATEKTMPMAAYTSTLEPTVAASPATVFSPENPLEEVVPAGTLADAYSGKLAFDPAALDITETKRKLLIQAYNRGLK